MYPYSIILRPQRGSYIGTLGSKYILYGYMEPLGKVLRAGGCFGRKVSHGLTDVLS